MWLIVSVESMGSVSGPSFSCLWLSVIDYNNHSPQWTSISGINITMCEFKVCSSTVMCIHNFAFYFKGQCSKHSLSENLLVLIVVIEIVH